MGTLLSGDAVAAHLVDFFLTSIWKVNATKAVANGEAKDELPENALINVLGRFQKR